MSTEAQRVDDSPSTSGGSSDGDQRESAQPEPEREQVQPKKKEGKISSKTAAKLSTSAKRYLNYCNVFIFSINLLSVVLYFCFISSVFWRWTNEVFLLSSSMWFLLRGLIVDKMNFLMSVKQHGELLKCIPFVCVYLYIFR